MVLQAYGGRSAWEGFSSPFTKTMKDKRKFAVAYRNCASSNLLATGLIGMVSLCASVIIAMVIHYSANKS